LIRVAESRETAVVGVRPPLMSLPRWSAMLGASGFEVLGRVSGRRPPLSRTGAAFFSEDRLYSWRKAHEELGYTPELDLARGVAHAIAWYRQQGWL